MEEEKERGHWSQLIYKIPSLSCTCVRSRVHWPGKVLKGQKYKNLWSLSSSGCIPRFMFKVQPVLGLTREPTLRLCRWKMEFGVKCPPLSSFQDCVSLWPSYLQNNSPQWKKKNSNLVTCVSVVAHFYVTFSHDVRSTQPDNVLGQPPHHSWNIQAVCGLPSGGELPREEKRGGRKEEEEDNGSKWLMLPHNQPHTRTPSNYLVGTTATAATPPLLVQLTTQI